jgi:hypothetical protein
MKVCRVCEKDKELSEFGLTAAGNPRGICKTCAYDQVLIRKSADPDGWKLRQLGINRKHKYGITPDKVRAMLEDQDNQCAICPEAIDYVTAHLDHCHNSLDIRGLLCKRCNTGLGMFRDQEEYLTSAIRYLRKHNG